MTRPISSRACAASSSALLAALLWVAPLSAGAQAQEAVATAPAVALEEAEAPLPARLQVGDATRNLLAMQRDGVRASPTPRPIAGDVASLSYQRYLDSFKFPIPEKFTATVQKPGSSSGSSR